MNIKIGDRVKVIEEFIQNILTFEVGDKGIVRYICKDSKRIVVEWINNYHEVLHDCEKTIQTSNGYFVDFENIKYLEVEKVKDIHKLDLKFGDRITLRDGTIFIYLDNKRMKNSKETAHLDDYQDNLLMINRNESDKDIVSIKRASYTDFYKRQETKKLTISEIEKELGMAKGSLEVVGE